MFAYVLRIARREAYYGRIYIHLALSFELTIYEFVIFCVICGT